MPIRCGSAQATTGLHTPSMKIKDLLPNIVATITHRPRQEIVPGRDFEWSSKSFVHGIFRAFEVIFGRAYGKNGVGDTIRPYMANTLFRVDGEERMLYRFYCWEAVFAHTEGLVRQFFTLPGFNIKFVPVVQLASPMGIAMPPIFSFAIALDTSADGGSTAGTSKTWNSTVTGANTVIFICPIIGVLDLITTVSQNAVALTQINKTQRGGTSRFLYTYYLVNPASGTTTSSVSVTAGGIDGTGSVSYTGVNQSMTYTGTPTDNSQVNNSASATSITVTLNTVADNSWIVGTYCDGGGGTPTGGTATTIRQIMAGTSDAIVDSGGAKTPAGSYSLIVNTNNGSQAIGIVAATFSPAVASSNVKTFDGVTQSTGIKTYFGVALASVKSVNGIT